MEFVLVPLLALAAVTAAINKLAGFLFHIHLSGRLLALLVGFAWLISLLPELFFHSAGFLGSIAVSLAGALGFACLAALYDIRTNAAKISPTVGVAEPEPMTAELPLPEPVEHGFEVAPVSIEEAATPEASLMDPNVKLANRPVERDWFESVSEGEPVFAAILATAIERPAAADEGLSVTLPAEPLPEPALATDESFASLADSPAAPTTAAEEIEMDSGQPVSDALPDLLEFAFEQRDRRHTAAALNTFRLIKHLYADSLAIPMVVAEIVSTLQNQGDYGEAAAELQELLQSPAIRRNGQQYRIFEQKLAELQAAAERTED